MQGHPIYIVCPDVLSRIGKTSYGIRVGLTEYDKVLSIIYLFESQVKTLHLSS